MLFMEEKNYTTQEQKDVALEEAKSRNQLVIFTHDTHSHYMSAYKMFIDNKFFGKGVKMFRKLCSKKSLNMTSGHVLHILIILIFNCLLKLGYLVFY